MDWLTHIFTEQPRSSVEILAEINERKDPPKKYYAGHYYENDTGVDWTDSEFSCDNYPRRVSSRYPSASQSALADKYYRADLEDQLRKAQGYEDVARQKALNSPKGESMKRACSIQSCKENWQKNISSLISKISLKRS